MREPLLYHPAMPQDGAYGQKGGPSDQQPLELLLVRIAQRDELAFAQFYDSTSARAYALARKIIRETSGAEDVVTEVYVQLWQRAGDYSPARGGALAWLLTICRSRALDHLRRRDAAELHAAPERLRPDLFCETDTPLDLLLEVERNSAVHAALSTLNDKERNVLSLAFFQGLSHQDIATQTGIPLGTVKTVLRRVVLLLRERLELPETFTPEQPRRAAPEKSPPPTP